MRIISIAAVIALLLFSTNVNATAIFIIKAVVTADVANIDGYDGFPGAAQADCPADERCAESVIIRSVMNAGKNTSRFSSNHGSGPWDGIGADNQHIPDKVLILVSDKAPPFSNAVPAPAALWLFGSGLLGLTFVARRQIRR